MGHRRGQPSRRGARDIAPSARAGRRGLLDNLGLETAWNQFETVLVSDGGGTLSRVANPPGGFLRQPVRVTQVIDRQVRALRKRLLIRSSTSSASAGVPAGDPFRHLALSLHRTRLPCPPEAVARLAAEPTRLARDTDGTRQRLMNWRYAVADASDQVGVRTLPHPPASRTGRRVSARPRPDRS